MCESTCMCFRERLIVYFVLVYRCVGDSRSGSENIMDVMWYFTLSVYICIYIYILMILTIDYNICYISKGKSNMLPCVQYIYTVASLND